MRRFFHGSLPFLDALRHHRLHKSLRLHLLDEHHRTPDDTHQQPKQRRISLFHADTEPAPLSGLSAYSMHRLSETHPVFNGSRDKLFPVEGVKDAYDTMQAVWQSQKAADRLVTKIWEEKHFFNKEMQKETLEFFNKWLK